MRIAGSVASLIPILISYVGRQSSLVVFVSHACLIGFSFLSERVEITISVLIRKKTYIVQTLFLLVISLLQRKRCQPILSLLFAVLVIMFHSSIRCLLRGGERVLCLLHFWWYCVSPHHFELILMQSCLYFAVLLIRWLFDLTWHFTLLNLSLLTLFLITLRSCLVYYLLVSCGLIASKIFIQNSFLTRLPRENIIIVVWWSSDECARIINDLRECFCWIDLA